jgi:hypothetical protein
MTPCRNTSPQAQILYGDMTNKTHRAGGGDSPNRQATRFAKRTVLETRDDKTLAR